MRWVFIIEIWYKLAAAERVFRQILASHGQVHGAGELPDFPRAVERVAGGRDWADGPMHDGAIAETRGAPAP